MDNRSKNKLTVVMIPDVTRPIKKTRFSRKLLYIVPSIGIAIVTAIAAWQVNEHVVFTNTIQHLSAQIVNERYGYEDTLSQKNQTIQQLHDDLYGIAEKAEVMQRELDELKAFEMELRELSDLPLSSLEEEDEDDGVFERVHIAAVGGPQRMATRSELNRLIQETEAAMEASGERMQQLNAALAEVKEAVLAQQKQLRHTPTLWPVRSRQVTSGYGFRRDPFTRATSFHNGIDIGARLNADVVATADGEVEAAGKDAAKGNYILINHSYSIHTQYMHLNKIYVKKGDMVEKGQVIGSVGSTGRSTGPHIHYEVWKNKQVVDPSPYMSEE